MLKSSLPAYSPTARAASRPKANTIREGATFACGRVGAETPLAAEVVLVEDDPAVSATVDVRDESIERFKRFRSARISAAVWQRMSRSFSIALLMISSSLGGS